MKHSIMLVDARERIADRYKPGGDKYEQIKADQEWDKAHQALLEGDMDTEVDEPHHYLVEIVDISEEE